jgi:hypothetical protein
MFVSPVVGGPPAGFQLQLESSSIGAGLALQEDHIDFNGRERATAPTLGLFEMSH